MDSDLLLLKGGGHPAGPWHALAKNEMNHRGSVSAATDVWVGPFPTGMGLEDIARILHQLDLVATPPPWNVTVNSNRRAFAIVHGGRDVPLLEEAFLVLSTPLEMARMDEAVENYKVIVALRNLLPHIIAALETMSRREPPPSR